jgi:D-inositol-3-phosphate glycosyltransferase
VRSGPSRRFFQPPAGADARARLGLPEDAFVAVGVGILFPHRRFEDLCEAIALLGDRPEMRALVIGSDHADSAYADRLDRLIASRRLNGRVTLRRQAISDEELRHVYAGADVFVFPNERQTWGLAPLEALVSGTPAIVSSGAGVHEVLEGRPGVQVVPPARPDAIAVALRALAGGGREEVGETAAWIREELSNERYAERMAAIFAEVTGRGSQEPAKKE